MKMIGWALLIGGYLMAPALVHAATCDDASNGRAYYISAPSQGDDWAPIDGVAVGGPGALALVIAQQAGAEGYRSITIDETGITTSGIEAELITNDLADGQVSFRACSDQGFLVQAVYLNEEGLVAGVPAEVLASSFENNYANVTTKSNERIGIKFNAGGAEGALAILNAQLQEVVAAAAAQFGALISGLEISLERVIAELVLTENVASVFDLSESQAPVAFPPGSSCRVQDHVVIHEAGDGQCVGRLNAAVDEVIKLAANGDETLLDTESFVTAPNEIYVARIAEGMGQREVIFVSRAVSSAGVDSE